MSKEMRFLVFAIEYYRQAKGLTGPEVAALFREKGLSQYVLDNYFLYHIESPDLMVADIDRYVETGERPGSLGVVEAQLKRPAALFSIFKLLIYALLRFFILHFVGIQKS